MKNKNVPILRDSTIARLPLVLRSARRTCRLETKHFWLVISVQKLAVFVVLKLMLLPLLKISAMRVPTASRNRAILQAQWDVKLESF